MKWASAVSTLPAIEGALAEAADSVAARLRGDEPDLLVAFVSEHHEAGYGRVPDLLRRRFERTLVLGCSGGGVIGAGHEVEREPGLSLTAAVLPDVALAPFHLESADVTALLHGARAWSAVVGSATRPDFLLLADPFSFETETLLAELDAVYPQSRKIGGLASGGRQPGANALYLGGSTYRSGAVGIALSGNVVVDTVVAQGCRPIGQPMFVTRCRHNWLLEIDGRAPLEVLAELFQGLEPRDQELFRHSLFLGVVMRERQEQYAQGDFLIRNLAGADEETGALAIGAVLHEGLVVQFHLRDARTSADDVEELLAGYRAEAANAAPEGALLFSCLGRGRFLYGEPDHDTGAFRRLLGDVALGGFFCNGEIGPVHGRTFLHGYTSSFALFRARG